MNNLLLLIDIIISPPPKKHTVTVAKKNITWFTVYTNHYYLIGFHQQKTYMAGGTDQIRPDSNFCEYDITTSTNPLNLINIKFPTNPRKNTTPPTAVLFQLLFFRNYYFLPFTFYCITTKDHKENYLLVSQCDS